MYYVITITATAAIPLSIFCWMMGAAAIALAINGESPRAVLAMPRTIFQRCQLMTHAEASNEGSVVG